MVYGVKLNTFSMKFVQASERLIMSQGDKESLDLVSEIEKVRAGTATLNEKMDKIMSVLKPGFISRVTAREAKRQRKITGLANEIRACRFNLKDCPTTLDAGVERRRKDLEECRYLRDELIVVILHPVTDWRGPFRAIASLAVHRPHRYKPATSIGAFQG